MNHKTNLLDFLPNAYHILIFSFVFHLYACLEFTVVTFKKALFLFTPSQSKWTFTGNNPSLSLRSEVGFQKNKLFPFYRSWLLWMTKFVSYFILFIYSSL